jgi:hypothetical protein
LSAALPVTIRVRLVDVFPVSEIAEPDTPALGYSIIEAETLQDSLALLEGCPMDVWVHEAKAMELPRRLLGHRASAGSRVRIPAVACSAGSMASDTGLADQVRADLRPQESPSWPPPTCEPHSR